jgi:hypothetical protein
MLERKAPMNLVNRVLIVVVLLLLILSCSVLFIAPAAVFSWLSAWSAYFGRLFGAAQAFTRPWVVQKVLGILFALAIDIILVLLVFLEVRRGSPRAIRVESTSGGEVKVAVSSIADRLRYEIDQLAGVLRVKAKVSGKRHGVVIVLDVQTVAGIDVPERAARIVEVAQLVTEEKMGLKLAAPPKVHLHTVSYARAPRVQSPGDATLSRRPAVAPDTNASQSDSVAATESVEVPASRGDLASETEIGVLADDE